ncbi:tectonin domain-containing protein [Streptomyces sp. NPDC086993]|uniref:tectonin domain-containing protein n=1 Tax=Streptomyces sp. NPDC086993 TaxID=3365765 RepID=UPI003805104A
MADWVKVAGALTAISAGSRTTVWGVNAASAIYRYTNYDAGPAHRPGRRAARGTRGGTAPASRRSAAPPRPRCRGRPGTALRPHGAPRSRGGSPPVGSGAAPVP